MKKQILFIQGGGDDGHHADKAMVASLQLALCDRYSVQYPELRSDESKPDYGWLKQIETAIADSKERVILAAHSFGASMLLKYLSENPVQKEITGIFLIATPFWKGDEDWQKGFVLKPDFANKLPKDVPAFFYHAKDDEEVPFAQFEQYRKKVSQATFREVRQGGHQLNNDLEIVTKDIQSL
jgi:uncharacterized protein